MAGVGKEVLADQQGISVRIVDGRDNFVAIRVGEHPYVARMSPDEADVVARMLKESAKRCRDRQKADDDERAERLQRLRRHGEPAERGSLEQPNEAEAKP
jgi:hypothetical protein